MPPHHQHDQRAAPHGTHGPHGPLDASATAALAELLDLDAEVLHAHLRDVTSQIEDLTTDRPPQRILDLGAGTGTGTFALLARFPDATAIAVDASEQMLDHLAGRAAALGLGERVRTVPADLDVAWPDLHNPDLVDLVWASASLHHLADPARVLTDVHAALRPGGLLAVAELEAFPRFLPEDVGFGRPGLEARCHAVLAAERATALPHLGGDWGATLTEAGFTVVVERPVTIDLAPPLPAAAGRYAQATLRRMRTGLTGRIDDDDLATLDVLLDSDGPAGVLRRDDLTVRAARSLWLARRP